MDSDWNLYRPFEPVSQELRLESKTMHMASAIKEGKLLFMMYGVRYTYSIYNYFCLDLQIVGKEIENI